MPTAGPIAAQTTVPDPVGYDADHLAAFNRLNELRAAAGLGLLYQNAAIDRASQAHAQWEIANHTISHVEQPGTSGFTGATAEDRVMAAGYKLGGVGEVAASGCDPSGCVDGLFNSIYHRFGLLDFRVVDAGIGWVPGPLGLNGDEFVIDLALPGDGTQRSYGQSPRAGIDGVAIWPVDGSDSVPISNGNERPDPVQTIVSVSLGTAASVNVDSESALEVSKFSMRRQVDGMEVNTILLNAASDPNKLLDQSFVAIVPLAVLEPATEYSVSFQGTVQNSQTGETRGVSRSWAFKTSMTSQSSSLSPPPASRSTTR